MRLAALAAVFALGACATQTTEAPADFDPAACYERSFDVYFEEYADNLTAEAREAVAAMDRTLAGCRIQHVRIIGMAGARGPAESNMELSVERAETIASYLAQETRWPRSVYELRAAGEEGATNTEEGLPRPMRRRGHVTVTAVAP
ncbi:MAG: OmpA family protein [Hyphomonadaceae bacterium]|nr:OmpA family protein [Hyphomonadaceae bacterium]